MRAKKETLFELLKNHYCAICKLPPIWNGKELVLQIDHIDGNRHNNDVSNLRLVCPNCHTQTDTFAGRNVKKQYGDFRKICAKDLENYFKNTGCYHLSKFCIEMNLNYKNPNCSKYLFNLLDECSVEYKNGVIANLPSISGFKKKSPAKFGSAQLYQTARKKQSDEQWKDQIAEIPKLSVNFQEFGWVGTVAEYLGITPQATNRWMKRYMPDFYANCYKRKAKVK